MPDRVTVTAPAKVNLLLDVGRLRSDGYHDVTTVLAALEFADTLAVERAASLSLVRDPEPAFPKARDLCWRAATLLADVLDRDPALGLAVTKRIPAAAGLGGGSADAAAVLVGACAVWGIPVQDPRVRDVARRLGADVPFLLRGGCARLGGRGDVFEAELPSPVLELVLVNPGVPAPTQAVYSAFDGLVPAAPLDPAPLERALATGEPPAVAAALANDLEAAAMLVAPQVAEVREWLLSRPGVLGALVAGSGATIFAVARTAGDAAREAELARQRGWWAVATRTSPYGAVATSASD